MTVVGGLAFFVATFILGMASGAVIHTGILEAAYKANPTFWQPALAADPPDMAAIMPYWIVSGIVFSFVMAGIYGCTRQSFSGPAWRKGLAYGLTMAVFYGAVLGQLSGVFYLPATIWFWWGVEALVIWTLGGAVMGIAAAKVAPES